MTAEENAKRAARLIESIPEHGDADDRAWLEAKQREAEESWTTDAPMTSPAPHTRDTGTDRTCPMGCGPVDEDGDTTGECAARSMPGSCETCGACYCDGSC